MMINGGALIGLHHTDHFDMIPKHKLTVNPPEIKEITVSIPGADGEIDLTDAILGVPTTTNRHGEWDFLVVLLGDDADRVQAYTNMLSAFNGSRTAILLDDQPSKTYAGRVWVKSWRPYKHMADVTLEYDIDCDQTEGGDEDP